MANEVKIIITAIDRASSELKKVEGSWKSTLTALGAIAAVATTVGVAVKKVVDETVEYNKQIREMTQVTGLGAEEISRIVQVGDDWGIEIGALRTSLGYMNKQGITPSIENLADLADEYVRSTDKSKFAEKAAKLLGRGYQTLIPLFAKGGDALRAQTEAIDENLIATEDSIEAARNYEVALDNWQDAVMGVKMAIGNELLPVLNQMLTPAVYEEIQGETYLVKTIGDTTTAWIREGQVLVDVTSKYETLKAKQDGVNFNMDQGARVALEYAESLSDVEGAASTANRPLAVIGETALLAAQDFAAAKAAADGFVISLGEVSEAQIASAAMDALNKALEDGTISAGQYASMASNVGYQILGMDTASMNAQIEMAELKQEYDSGKISASQYVSQLQALNNQINNLHDKTVDITINTWYREYYQRHGEGPNPRQGGGPVQRNMPYIVGERGPEMFVPGTAGKIVPNDQLRGGSGGDIYASFVINATQGQSPRAIAREVYNMLTETTRRAQAGGYIQGV